MGVDIFGRTLVRAKEVHQGPAGIGFTLSDEGHFDIGKRRLCNVAPAEELTDAVTLKDLKLIADRLIQVDGSLKVLENKFLTEFNLLNKQINDKIVYVQDLNFTNIKSTESKDAEKQAR